MSLIEGLALFGVGIFSGVINTLAGGGSLITLPLLIFMGLPIGWAFSYKMYSLFEASRAKEFQYSPTVTTQQAPLCLVPS
jgi:uncharacterized membrane protein YfcA